MNPVAQKSHLKPAIFDIYRGWLNRKNQIFNFSNLVFEPQDSAFRTPPRPPTYNPVTILLLDFFEKMRNRFA